jgi:GntR family transcriptional regulator, rspAB operon transcriptional repressor
VLQSQKGQRVANHVADESRARLESVFSGRHDRRKVTDWVYEELKSAIVDLRLAPGEPLREATLADRLGVSKTPIREALTRLEQEGLVETTSFKGAVVTRYSRQDLVEIYELRELLENAAVRAAAQSMTEQDLTRLERIASESRRLQGGKDQGGKDQGGPDRGELAALITEFDVVLYDQVRNHRIQALIENLRAHLTRIGQLTAEIPGRIDASVDEHEKIVEAIAARDPALAEQCMREHIRSVRDDQLRALEDAPEQA